MHWLALAKRAEACHGDEYRSRGRGGRRSNLDDQHHSAGRCDVGAVDHFLITIPVVTQSVQLQLPQESNVPRQTKPENIELAVTKDGDVYWGMQLIKDNDELVNRLKAVAVLTPQPELHIRGDLAGRYEFVGRVVFAAQRAGIQKIGFVTEPPPRG